MVNRRLGSALALVSLAILLPLLGQEPTPPRTDAVPPAFRTVARAWSLPPETVEAALGWAGARAADLAVAAFLSRNGGPPPTESWSLKLSLHTWDATARKAGVPVDALLKGFRERINEQTRASLGGEGEELVVMAELQTLERLTGKGSQAIAAELAAKGFDALLRESAPAGGVADARPRPASPRDGAPGAPGDADMNPLQPLLDQTLPNTGSIGATSTHQTHGR